MSLREELQSITAEEVQDVVVNVGDRLQSSQSEKKALVRTMAVDYPGLFSLIPSIYRDIQSRGNHSPKELIDIGGATLAVVTILKEISENREIDL